MQLPVSLNDYIAIDNEKNMNKSTTAYEWAADVRRLKKNNQTGCVQF